MSNLKLSNTANKYSEIQEMFITMKFLQPLVSFFSKSNLTIDCKNHTEIGCFQCLLCINSHRRKPMNIEDETVYHNYHTQSTYCHPFSIQRYIRHIPTFPLHSLIHLLPI